MPIIDYFFHLARQPAGHLATCLQVALDVQRIYFFNLVEARKLDLRGVAANFANCHNAHSGEEIRPSQVDNSVRFLQ
jgi:hypothetical protein